MNQLKYYVRKFVFGVVISAGLFGVSPVAVSAESEEVKKQMAVAVAQAKAQLVHLMSQSTEEYQSRLLKSEDPSPAAWMLMKDGDTVKKINMGSAAVDAPKSIKLMMYRAAIKSVAQRKQILAAAILYSGQLSEGNRATALVIEHEHMVGVSGHKVVGYEVSDGKVLWGEPVGHKKPFEWFYDGKKTGS